MPRENRPTSSITDRIVDCAKVRNESNLNYILSSERMNINSTEGARALALLAEEGNDGAVVFLIDRFRAHPYWAIAGFISGGHHSQIRALTAAGIARNEAALAYASFGVHARVAALINEGADRVAAVKGYEADGYIDLKRIVFLLVRVEDVALRELLARKMQEKEPSVNLDALFEQVAKFRFLMKEMSFDQAMSLSREENKIWFLQGFQLVEKERLPLDCFFKISTLLTGLSIDKAMEKHEKAVQDSVRSNASELLNREIRRLSSFSVLSLEWLGMLKPSAEKITALEQLAEIISKDVSESGQMKSEIVGWYSQHRAVITEQRNGLHTFFQPTHLPRSLTKFKEVCNLFKISEDDLNHSSFLP